MPLMRCERRSPASVSEVADAERLLGTPLPSDYKALVGETNGLEGFVTPEAYLLLWAISDVPSLNEGYAVREFLPGVTLIGTDGGGTGYGFRQRAGRFEYLRTPLVGMSPAAITPMGASLEALAAGLREGC